MKVKHIPKFRGRFIGLARITIVQTEESYYSLGLWWYAVDFR